MRIVYGYDRISVFIKNRILGTMNNGLVDVSDEMPKTAAPRKFEAYLGRAINEKQREISNLMTRAISSGISSTVSDQLR